MQQLQSSYGGDRSDTLAQILGGDYDPQGQMAAMAQQMLATGMGSSTQLKTRAMADAAQLNRDMLQRQYLMNDAKIARRQALADEKRKREMQLEDMGMARQQKLEDVRTAREYALEDAETARNAALEDALRNRGYSLEDFYMKDLAGIESEERADRRTIDAERRKLKDLTELAKSKGQGTLTGLLFNLNTYRDYMSRSKDPNIQRQAAGIDQMIGMLSGFQNAYGDDPMALQAALGTIMGAGLPEAQTAVKLSEVMARGGPKQKKDEEGAAEEELRSIFRAYGIPF